MLLLLLLLLMLMLMLLLMMRRSETRCAERHITQGTGGELLGHGGSCPTRPSETAPPVETVDDGQSHIHTKGLGAREQLIVVVVDLRDQSSN